MCPLIFEAHHFSNLFFFSLMNFFFRGRRRRYIQTENGWECVECGLAMSKREYMRGHYEECMGGGKVLPNVPKGKFFFKSQIIICDFDLI